MKKLLFFLMLMPTLGAQAASSLHMVNVNKDLNGGHGDAYVLLSEGNVTLVDTGRYSQAQTQLVPYLRSLNIRRIDNILLTHPHRDHADGVRALIEAGIQIDRLYHNPIPVGIEDFSYQRARYQGLLNLVRSNGGRIVNVRRGMLIRTGQGRLTIIHAHKDRVVRGQELGVNNFSVVSRWDSDGVLTLFAGDLEEEVGTLVAANEAIEAHVLTTPHHGGLFIGPPALYRNVNAKLHLYSSTVGIWDIVSGPSRRWTADLNALFCHSALNGHVVLSYRSGAVTIQPERAARGIACNGRFQGRFIERSGSTAGSLPSVMDLLLYNKQL